MDFYFVARNDGMYDLICTRCFATVVSTNDPSSFQAHQALHRCTEFKAIHPGTTPVRESRKNGRARIAPKPLIDLQAVRFPVLLIIGVLLLYALPTAIELLLLQRINRRVDIVVVGDLLGCACIFFILKRRRVAIAVYVITAAFETVAYGLDLLSTQALCCIADAVPTLVVFSMLR